MVLCTAIRDHKNMAYHFPYIVLTTLNTWIPTEGFIYGLLVVGAFLIAGVSLSIFTFYEDCYWGDKAYRKFLKEGRKSSAKV